MKENPLAKACRLYSQCRAVPVIIEDSFSQSCVLLMRPLVEEAQTSKAAIWQLLIWVIIVYVNNSALPVSMMEREGFTGEEITWQFTFRALTAPVDRPHTPP